MTARTNLAEKFFLPLTIRGQASRGNLFRKICPRCLISPPYDLDTDSRFENSDIRKFSTHKEFEYDGFGLKFDSVFTEDSPFPEFIRLNLRGKGLFGVNQNYRQVLKYIETDR